MARLTPPHLHSPHVIPADAGNQGNTKHAISPPPLRTAKGTRAQHAGDARNSPQHPITQQHVPSPLVQPVGAVREPPLPPTSQKYPLPQQRVPSPARRERARVRATGRPRGAGHPLPPITATTPSHTTPAFPSFPIFRILVQLFPKVPQFQNAPYSAKYPYFPTQHLTGTAHLY